MEEQQQPQRFSFSSTDNNQPIDDDDEQIQFPSEVPINVKFATEKADSLAMMHLKWEELTERAKSEFSGLVSSTTSEKQLPAVPDGDDLKNYTPAEKEDVLSHFEKIKRKLEAVEKMMDQAPH